MIRRFIIMLWTVWDTVYSTCSRLKHVKKRENIFRVVVKRYRGEEIRTEDGVSLKPGDWYAQLHLHNSRLAALLLDVPKNEFAWALTLTKFVRKSLPGLARFLDQHPLSREIKVILGTTFLTKGSGKLGFEVAPMPRCWQRRLKVMSIRLIFLLCHPNGWREIRSRSDKLIPQRVYMSRERLNQVHGA
ncbi:YkoP family protein [Staphylospora marina]|uniref:YkoP family protein n=1 Tax=Staphylospora marina TaxID=2490858 RepID=UPI000F5B9A9C|nr:hypothetical protein [Staphylospora marina]